MKDYFRDTLATISDEYERQTVATTISLTTTGVTATVNVGTNISASVELGAAVEVTASGGAVTSTGLTVIDIPTATSVTLSGTFNFASAGDYTNITFITYRRGMVIGAWDAHQSAYTLSLIHI